jgi:energy-coupling factor transporter ATP-binding protein EcfA2
MILKGIKYHRAKGDWRIEGRPVDGKDRQWLTLGQINLVVGQNATGKSKTIDAIREIADLISGEMGLDDLVYDTGEYELLFENDGIEIYYLLEFQHGAAVDELLVIDGIQKLNRRIGLLYYDKVGSMLDFETDPDILAVTRRDGMQHSFFDVLHFWGKSLNHHKFGSSLGRGTFVRDLEELKTEGDFSLKNTNKVIEAFLRGEKQDPIHFKSNIMADMKEIGYDLLEIGAEKPSNIPFPAFGLEVKEKGLAESTHQVEMSQGMFRALSLIIQLNYSLQVMKPSCILIDDIGEGLDYDRSKALIDLIIRKVQGSQVQLIMTTNDRFVMNKIPLEYWCVIQRQGNHSYFYNYENSKKTFDEFAFTGLNNFDFFSSGFFEKGFEEFVAEKQ